MAMFCTNCGASLPATTGFCPSCGTPIGAPVQMPQQGSTAVPVQAPPPPPAYVQAPPSPSPSAYVQVGAYPAASPKSGALRVVLIVVATVVGLGVLGFGALVFIGWRAAKSITTTNNGTGATTTVPGVGTVTTGTAAKVTDQDLGVPLYPGASMDASASSTIAKGTTKVVQATYWTTDPVSSVTSFYQAKLGSGLNVMALGDETIMSYGGGNNTVTLMVDSESGKTKMNVIHTVTQGQ